jgi:cyclopropane fatty-acyl-phospholipid synthase-like methyltransferase
LTAKKHSRSLSDADPVSYYKKHGQTYMDNNQNPADFIDEFLGLLQGKRILDLGSGHGVNANYMQSKGFRVVGIDLSNKMVAHARKAYPDVEFRVDNMAKLQFPTDSFDGIFASYSLIHLTKDVIHPVLKKLNKILRSGGIISVSL